MTSPNAQNLRSSHGNAPSYNNFTSPKMVLLREKKKILDKQDSTGWDSNLDYPHHNRAFYTINSVADCQIWI